jgi:hypothetical protein
MEVVDVAAVYNTLVCCMTIIHKGVIYCLLEGLGMILVMAPHELFICFKGWSRGRFQ